MKKRLIRIAIASGVGLVLLILALVVVLSRKGPGSVQDWIGAQLQTIADRYLNPKLTFTNLSYQYPLAVSLKNLHLTADDPAHPGRTIDIIACDSAAISLAEIPVPGRPIVIQKIVLDHPLITAEAVQPRSKQFVGFSDLLHGEKSGKQPADSAAPQKLSDVFQMRLVQIKDGRIVYDPRIAGTTPMSLDQINTTLNIEPADAGWYKLDTVIARQPLFELKLAGQVNLDTFNARDFDLNLTADLGREKLDYLPPELQQILKTYDAHGKLGVEVSGSLPLMDPLKGDVKASIKLDGANVTAAGMRVPIDHLDLEAALGNGQAAVNSLKITALDGSLLASGSVALNDPLDAALQVKVTGMILQQLLADPNLAAAAPARLDLDMSVAAPLMALTGGSPVKAGTPVAQISVKDFKLSADDPANAGQRLSILACNSFEVAVTEPLVAGKPLVIDRIVLDQLQIQAIAAEPGRWVGLPSFGFPAPAAGNSTASSSGLPRPKLSDSLRVKSFELNGAKFVYDPRIDGTQRMQLDDVTAALKEDAADPGVYRINLKVARGAAFSLGVDGLINVDEPAVNDLSMHAQADLTATPVDFLPPQLQRMVKDLKVAGKLETSAHATVVFADPSKAAGQFDLSVRDLKLGDPPLPVDAFSISASLQNGIVTHKGKISALASDFELSGTTVLNPRLDSDLTLTLKDIELEKIAGLLNPGKPALKSSTKLSGEVEVRAPVMVYLGMTPASASETVPVIMARRISLTTNDPRAQGRPLEFAALDDLALKISSLPATGRPIGIDSVVVTHPALRAVAVTPNSNSFAGFVDIEKIADDFSAVPATSATATRPTAIAIDLKSAAVSEASLYYDSRENGGLPLSVDHIAAKVDRVAAARNAYQFELHVPNQPDFQVNATGRINLGTMVVNALNADVSADLGRTLSYDLPPAASLLRAYHPTGMVAVKVAGRVPLADVAAADLNTEVRLENIVLTVGDYRIPIDHGRLPIRLVNRQLTLSDPAPLGGPTIQTLGGAINATGVVKLDSQLDSTLNVSANGLLIESLMASQISLPKRNMVGVVQANVNLTNAPLRLISAKAFPDPATFIAAAPPLPDHWGTANVSVSHARLAGFELIQDIDNFTTSSVSGLFNNGANNPPPAIIPKESANLVFSLGGDRATFSTIHYEGEVVAADGTGTITLQQDVDLTLTGGPIAKLGGLGAVGNWLKNASESLLYYHITGTFQKLHYEVKTGNGQPFVQGAKSVGAKVEKGINNGLDTAGSLLNDLFNRGNQDQAPNK